MGPVQKLIQNGFIYSFSILFVKAGQFFLLPLYWKALEPEHFGIIGMCQVTLAILVTVFDLGSSSTLQRMYHEWKGRELSRYLGATWIISNLPSSIIATLLFVFGSGLFSSIYANVPFSPFIECMIVSAVFQNFSALTISLLRIKDQLAYFTVYSVLFFITQTSFILAGVFYFEMGVKGYIYGLTASTVLFGLWSLFYFWTFAKLNFKKKYYIASLKYGLPIAPSAVIESLAGSIERITLERLTSLSVAGFYTLGSQIGSIINVVNQIIKSSFIPLLYKYVDEEKRRSVLGRLSLAYLGLISAPAVCLIFIIDDIILLTEKTKYFQIIEYIPFFIVGYWIHALGTAFARGIDLTKKTYLNPIVPICALGANLFFSINLIPKFGIWGAIGTFILTAFTKTMIGVTISVIVYPRPFYYKKLITILSLFATIFLLDLYYISKLESIVLDITLITFISPIFITVALGFNDVRNGLFKMVKNFK